MRNIRLSNVALLLVETVLFVQDIVPAGTESLGDSDSRIACSNHPRQRAKRSV